MMYELSPKAQRVDEQFHLLGEKWDLFNKTLGNKHGYQAILSGINAIREGLGSIGPSSEFEALWANDANHNLDVMEALAHQYHGRPKMPITKLVDLACGPGTYEMIEDSFTGYDHEGQWNMQMEEAKRDANEVRTNTKEVQSLIEQAMPRIMGEVLAFGIAHGYLPEGFEPKVDLALPGTYGRAHWNPQLKGFFLGADHFDCYDRNGSLHLDPVRAYKATFHEILGHASHQFFSEQLPKSLQMLDTGLLKMPAKVVYEGLALHREKMAFQWLRDSMERLGIGPQDIDLHERVFESNMRYIDMPVALGILKEREFFEGLNIREYMEKLTDVKRTAFRYVANPGSNTPKPIQSALYEICYHAGYKIMNEITHDMRDVDKKKLHKAQATGLWGWKTYPQAVRLFLQE